MPPDNSKQARKLPADIGFQIHTAANVRFLRALPTFQIDPDMPNHFDDLLAEMDNAERMQRPAKHRG